MRAHDKAQLRMGHLGESPAELRLLCESMIHVSGIAPCKPWTDPRFTVTSFTETVVPFTTDHMLAAAMTFMQKGMSTYQRPRFLRLVGDATHDQSRQRLKKMVIGLAGTHFYRGQWHNTILPLVYILCAQETKVALQLGLDFIEAVFANYYHANFLSFVERW